MNIALITTANELAMAVLLLPWYSTACLGVVLAAMVISSDADWNDGYFVWPVVAVGIVFLWVTVGNPFMWAYYHPDVLASAVMQYVIVGLLYSFGRWAVFVIGKANYVRDNKEMLIKGFDVSSCPTFGDYLVRYDYVPSASKEKYRLFLWFTYWPFSLLNWLLSDCIKWLWEVFILFFGGLYDRISRSVLRRAGLDTTVMNMVKKEEKKN